MFWLEWTERHAGAKAAMVALVLTAALLLGEAAASGHGDCHDDGPCAVCLLAMASSCVPEAAPQVLPAPAPQLRSVLLPVSLPSCRPVFAMPTRGPPLNVL